MPMIKLKNLDEINKIRESCRLLAETYDYLTGLAGVGVTTLELDRAARSFIEKRGGRPAFLHYQGFPASLCASVNQVVIHGIPNKRKMASGDILSMDLGIDLKGYISDAALSIPIGTVSPEARQLLTVTEECLYKGIEACRTGNRIKDISRAVFEHATSYGYGVVRDFCGHGVGFDLHEEPQIPNYVGRGPNPRIKAGMVVAIEPMINIGTDDVVVLDDEWTVETRDGSLSAHFEHTVAVFEDHTEILTKLD